MLPFVNNFDTRIMPMFSIRNVFIVRRGSHPVRSSVFALLAFLISLSLSIPGLAKKREGITKEEKQKLNTLQIFLPQDSEAWLDEVKRAIGTSFMGERDLFWVDQDFFYYQMPSVKRRDLYRIPTRNRKQTYPLLSLFYYSNKRFNQQFLVGDNDRQFPGSSLIKAPLMQSLALDMPQRLSHALMMLDSKNICLHGNCIIAMIEKHRKGFLYLYYQGRMLANAEISSGQGASWTTAGNYKAVTPYHPWKQSRLYNDYPMPYAIHYGGRSNSEFLHAGNIGGNSHGCIRMPALKSALVWKLVKGAYEKDTPFDLIVRKYQLPKQLLHTALKTLPAEQPLSHPVVAQVTEPIPEPLQVALAAPQLQVAQVTEPVASESMALQPVVPLVTEPEPVKPEAVVPQPQPAVAQVSDPVATESPAPQPEAVAQVAEPVTTGSLAQQPGCVQVTEPEPLAAEETVAAQEKDPQLLQEIVAALRKEPVDQNPVSTMEQPRTRLQQPRPPRTIFSPSHRKPNRRTTRIARPNGVFAVAVGSYQKTRHANRIQRQLDGMGFQTYRQEVWVAGRLFQRIRVGPVHSHRAARQQLWTLKHRSRLGGSIVTYGN